MSEVKVKKEKQSRVSFSLEIDEKAVKKAQGGVIQSMKSQINVPGFRKGHAPEEMVIAQIGIERLAYEATNKAVEKAYQNFVVEKKLAVITAPEVEFPKDTDKLPWDVKFTVEVYPEVTLGDYKALSLKKPSVRVTKKEIEDVLKTICAQSNIGKVVERAAEKEDLIRVDFAGKDEKGEILPNTEGKDHQFRIGMGHFLPDLEAAFEGMKAGESKEAVDVNFPEDYHAKDMAGKTVKFDITLHEVSEIDPKSLTEEQIEQFSGKRQSLADFETQIKETITQNKEQEKKRELEQDFNKKLAKLVKVDLPQSWLDKEVSSRLDRIKQSPLFAQDQEKFWKTMGKSEEDMKKEFLKEGEEALKTFLGLSEVVKLENIELDKDEQEQALAMAQHRGGNSHAIEQVNLEMKIDKYLKSIEV